MDMWGDVEGAYSLQPSDELSTSLLQITGPTHIPYNDARWQQLLLQYEKLVHVHNLGLVASSAGEGEEEDVVGHACRQCAKHSAATSNLAAFTLHVARMIRDLQSSVESCYSTPSNENVENAAPSTNVGTHGTPPAAQQQVSLIGKARVTCGAMNLLRILSHETIVQACGSQLEATAEDNTRWTLNEAFTYRSQDNQVNAEHSTGRDAAEEIIVAIMAFLSSVGRTLHQQGGGDGGLLSIPEMYDVMVQIFSLLLVLLSTQLYLPLVSSAELEHGQPSGHIFLEKWMNCAHWQRMHWNTQRQNEEERMRQQQAQILGQENMGEPANVAHNEPLLFLRLCLRWLVDRPSPPRRSIASHYVDLPKSIAQQMTNMAVAPDGMYASHSIVMASAPSWSQNKAAPKSSDSSARAPIRSSEGKSDTTSQMQQNSAISLGTDDAVDLSSPGHISGDISSWNAPSSMLLRPIRSILLLSSSFLFLPIRLMRLAFGLLGQNQHHAILGGVNMENLTESDHLILQQLQAQSEKKSGWNKTNNVLWLSESPIADLASALVLILINNHRAHPEADDSAGYQNPFRVELASLSDIRWNKEADTATENALFPPLAHMNDNTLSVNFESLFKAFGRVAHTEVGALTLYTLILSSPIFAGFLSAKSDLDELVMPLLRSLYFSTTMALTDPKSTPNSGSPPQPSQLVTLTPNNRPFRTQSQLYVILILLLIFSQDPSFGRDSFRRVHVSAPTVNWYKERHIKHSSLGSMILLVLLKAIAFNLNQLQDEFLLSNCYAVLLNLSPHITDLNDHVSSRLVSMTTSCFKRYAILMQENGGEPEMEGDVSTPLGMHGETCRTFLTLIKHSIRRRCLEKNIHLVYAIMREQKDFEQMWHFESLGDTSPISSLIHQANNIITENGHGKVISAERILGMLKTHLVKLKAYSLPEGMVSDVDSLASDASNLGNLTFTYEEESDPEVFFVPYVWDVVVGTLGTTSMEWSRMCIQVFPLNEDEEVDSLAPTSDTAGLDSIEAGEHDNTPFVV